jgi:hypothetical protein
MSRHLQAEYRITEDDYVRVLRLDLAGRPALLLVCGVILMMLMVAVWSIRGGAGAIMAIPVVFGIFAFIAWTFQARRSYQLNKDIQESITVEFDDDGFRFSAVDGHSKLPWPKISKWRQDDQFILVYKMQHSFHIVPKSVAQAGFDVALLVKRLTEHVGPERWPCRARRRRRNPDVGIEGNAADDPFRHRHGGARCDVDDGTCARAGGRGIAAARRAMRSPSLASRLGRRVRRVASSIPLGVL